MIRMMRVGVHELEHVQDHERNHNHRSRPIPTWYGIWHLGSKLRALNERAEEALPNTPCIKNGKVLQRRMVASSM